MHDIHIGGWFATITQVGYVADIEITLPRLTGQRYERVVHIGIIGDRVHAEITQGGFIPQPDATELPPC